MLINAWLSRFHQRSQTAPRSSRRTHGKPKRRVPVVGTENLEQRRLLSASPSPDHGEVTPLSDESDRILIQLADGASIEELSAQMSDWQTGSEVFTTTRLISIELTAGVDAASAVEAYREHSLVSFAEPDSRVALSTTSNSIPDDVSFSGLYALHNTGQTGGLVDADIDAPEAWDITTGNASTIVAVIDTGVDYTHEDLAGNIWINTGEIPGNGVDDDGNGFADDIHGYDFFANDPDPMDENGHGTHVSGTIGAAGNNGLGIVGVNQQIQIMPVRFLGPDGSGYTSDAIRALDYAVSNGAVISNNSWGGGGYSEAMRLALENARDAGHIFVAAAGNDSADHDSSPHYPSSYSVDNVVSVAATDHNDELAWFSNYGSATVDVAAPGLDILSTTPGNNYEVFSGTSMAAPHAAGVLALIRSVHPDCTVSQLVHQLAASSDSVSGLDGLTSSDGRINAARALDPTFQSRARLNFDRGRYEAGETLTARLVDFDLVGVGTHMTVVYASSGDSEWISLNAIEPGVFEGSIATTADGGDTDNVLNVVPGDDVWINIQDADDGTGNPADISATSRILADDHGDDAATATAVAMDTSTLGEVEISGDHDWFRFDAVAGQHYVLNTDLDSLSDSVLELYNQDGETLLVEDDDGGDGLSSRIEWTAPEDGAYFLNVRGWLSSQTGTYSINVNDTDPPGAPEDDHGDNAASATAVAMNSATGGVIEVGLDLDWFSFEASAGLSYDFTTELGTIVNTTLALYDQDGETQLAFNRNGGPGQASWIHWPFTSSGTYFLRVGALNSATTGSYTLHVNEADSPTPPQDDHGDDFTAATPVESNSQTVGAIETNSDVDWFAIDAVEGGNYEFSTELDTLSDSTLTLFDQDGATVIEYDDDGGLGLASRIEWTAAEAGTYFLQVAAYSSLQTGSYVLNVTATDIPAPQELIDLTVRFTNESGQPLERLRVGQAFRIEVLASDLRQGDDWQGVLSAFADVLYDSNLIDVTGIQHVFDDFTFGSLIDGEADDTGGLELDAPLTAGPQTVFILDAIARRIGTLQVDTNAAEHVLAENLLLGLDDDLRDQTRYGSGSIPIEGELSLVIAADAIREDAGAGATSATVSRSADQDLSQPLIVTLSSSDTTEATVPETVTIPAGATSVLFEIDAVDDDVLDGVQTVSISATADGHTPASDTVDVTDFELPDLRAVQFDVTNDHLLGGVATVELEVANNGTGIAGTFGVDLVLSEDSIIGNQDDVVIGTLEFPEGLNPGETVRQQVDTNDLRSPLYALALAQDPPGQGIGHLSGNVLNLGMQIDAGDVVEESSELNNAASDDVTYFPWDVNGSGTVTPADVGYVLNRIGNTDPIADMDGNGTVTPTEVVATLNRIGYARNDNVFDSNDSTETLAGINAFAMRRPDAAARTNESLLSSDSDPMLGLTIEFTDLSGNSIESLQVGQEFQILLLADDLRGGAMRTAVVSAYADLRFDADLIEVSGISHAFASFPSGTVDNESGFAPGVGGLHVDFGSASETGPQLVAVLNARAKSPGSVTITTEPTHAVELQNTMRLTDADVRDVTDYGSTRIRVVEPQFVELADGTLTVTLDDSTGGNLRPDVDAAGFVKLHLGEDAVATRIVAVDVTSLVIMGTSENDVIDLSAVTRAAFPALSSIRIDGDAGDDVLTLASGESIPARILGGPGNDVIHGGAGHDQINGGSGNDLIRAGHGNDSIQGEGGADTVFGGGGHDEIRGGDSADVLLGNGGRDSLRGDAGNDIVRGHIGRDFMIGGDGHDLMFGGDGHDRMRGEDGNDSLDGGSGRDLMFGDRGHDRLFGRGGNDRMSGGSGFDFVHGNGGHDLIKGNSGDDTLRGASGNDLILAHGGNDLVKGDQGNDTLLGHDGNDTLLGGTGHDGLAGGDDDDLVFGHAGRDTVLGGRGHDLTNGHAGADIVLGGDGDDTVTALGGLSEMDTAAGGAGNDVVLAAEHEIDAGFTFFAEWVDVM